MMQVFPTNAGEWASQKRALEDRIQEKHLELERAGTMEAVAFLQGEIASLRWLIDGAEPTFRPGVGHGHYGAIPPEERDR